MGCDVMKHKMVQNGEYGTIFVGFCSCLLSSACTAFQGSVSIQESDRANNFRIIGETKRTSTNTSTTIDTNDTSHTTVRIQ